jgi:hypothetical protein
MVIKPWKTINTIHLHPNIRLDDCELPNGQIITPHVLEYNDEIMGFALTMSMAWQSCSHLWKMSLRKQEAEN